MKNGLMASAHHRSLAPRVVMISSSGRVGDARANFKIRRKPFSEVSNGPRFRVWQTGLHQDLRASRRDH